jgi:galactokinase
VNDAERLAKAGMRAPAFFVPGRIEVLGKHTDYAGGRSLLCAVERGILFSVEPRMDSLVRITDVVRGETREIRFNTRADAPLGDWANYVATVARRVAANFEGKTRGADIRFASDLPEASGLSSSSALSIGIFLALDRANGLAEDPRYTSAIRSTEDLAAYIASVEMGEGFGSLRGDRGVGTFGGSEDHTAILCCRAEHLSRYSFLPTRAEGDVPFPADKTFVVAFSGIAAAKTGRALDSYNEASVAVRRIVELWNSAMHRSDRSLAVAAASQLDAPDRLRELIAGTAVPGFTPARLRERFEQFLLESESFIPQATDAFVRRDFAEFGRLVALSQQAAEALLRNQIPETSALVRMARDIGAHAASAFGGGFGGSVWALVDTSNSSEFLGEWRRAYAAQFPEAAERAEFFVTPPAAGARAIT